MSIPMSMTPKVKGRKAYRRPIGPIQDPKKQKEAFGSFEGGFTKGDLGMSNKDIRLSSEFYPDKEAYIEGAIEGKKLRAKDKRLEKKIQALKKEQSKLNEKRYPIENQSNRAKKSAGK